MSNIEKLSDALKNCPSQLRAELNYQLFDITDREFEEGETYSIADAFKDTWDNAESWEDKTLLKQCYDIAVKCGYYVPVNIDNVVYVSHGKKYAYKTGGIHYECSESWSEWIKK